MLRILPALCLLLCLLENSSRAQSLPNLGTSFVVPQSVGFDSRTILDDLDGDGVQDFAGANLIGGVGIPIFSGATGVVIRHVHGAPEGFAINDTMSVVGLEDVDGDGLDDYAVVVANPSLGLFATTLVIRSGIDDATIFSFDSPGGAYVNFDTLQVVNDSLTGMPLGLAYITSGNALRVRLAMSGTLVVDVVVPGTGGSVSLDDIGDVDADAVEDLVLGAPSFSTSPTAQDQVVILSTVDGSTIQSIQRVAPNEDFGEEVRDLGDLDGDGTREYLVFSEAAAPFSPTTGVGFVEVFSLAASTPLYQVFAEPMETFLRTLASSDLDGDGCRDFSMLVRRILPQGAQVYLTQHYSGRTGFLLGESAAGPFFPFALRIEHGIRDSNGDGFGEILNLGPPSAGSSQTGVVHRTLSGAETYGAGTAGRSLRWEPGPNEPRTGRVILSGASPSAALLLAASLQPANGSFSDMGMSYPLHVSPADLILTANLAADAQGELRIIQSLQSPVIAGTVVYLQAAELSPQPNVSNGLELLFGN